MRRRLRRGAGIVFAACVLAWLAPHGAVAHRKGGMGPRPAPRPPMQVPGPNVGPHVGPNLGGKNPVADRIGDRGRPRGPLRPSEDVVRTALGLPPSGPLSPEQQAQVDEILSVWEAIDRGELPEYRGDDTSIGPVNDIPVLGPTPQHVIDRENLIAAARAHERKVQEWRGWLITKIGGFLVGQAGGGYVGAIIYNEAMSGSSDPNTAEERAVGKLAGDLSGDALGAGSGYVAGRVAERLVPGSGTMVSGAVEQTVSQVMGDQIENALKDEFIQNRGVAAAQAQEQRGEVTQDTFGGPLRVPPAPTPSTGGGSGDSIPVMRDAGGGSGDSIPVLREAGSRSDSIPVMRATRDEVPVMRASPSNEAAGRNAGSTQAAWWAR